MRYAILTDIHANSHALQAVADDVRHQEGEIRYWFLGDLIGYGPDPIGCLRWLKYTARIGTRWVPGNHDEWLVNPSAVTADAKESLEKHRDVLTDPNHSEWYDWFAGQVTQTMEQRSLVIENSDDMTIAFTHASIVPSLRRATYLYPWEKLKLEAEFRAIQQTLTDETATKVLFHGHTHFPIWAVWENERVKLRPIAFNRPLPLGKGTFIINPGSVGQPRDGDSRAAYLLFDPEAKTVEFRRVVYAIHEATDALRSQGYSPRLAYRLETGDGFELVQSYRRQAYRRPYDLEPIEDFQPGLLERYEMYQTNTLKEE